MVKKVFLHNFVKGAIKPLGKILRIKRTDKKYFLLSELQEVEVRICVQPNFPIMNLILFTAFHKFARSRGPNTSVLIALLRVFAEIYANT